MLMHDFRRPFLRSSTGRGLMLLCAVLFLLVILSPLRLLSTNTDDGNENEILFSRLNGPDFIRASHEGQSENDNVHECPKNSPTVKDANNDIISGDTNLCQYFQLFCAATNDPSSNNAAHFIKSSSDGHGLVALGVQGSQSFLHPERGIARYTHQHAMEILQSSDGLVSFCDFDRTLTLPPLHMICAAHADIRFSGTETLLNYDRPKIYHIMSPFEDIPSVWPRWAHDHHVRIVVTLFDMIPMEYPDVYFAAENMRKKYMEDAEIVKQADGILAISNAAASDGIKYLGLDPSRVFVIGTGVGDEFVSFGKYDLEKHPIQTPGVQPEFILSATGDDYRKNIRGLLKAYAILPPQIKKRYQLVIACKMSEESQESSLKEMRNNGYSESPGNILFTGYIPDEELQVLYWHAKLFVFPSLKEGFGLPIVEAVRSGTLPVVSKFAPMSEIVPIGELHFDPFSPVSISETIKRALLFPSSKYKILVEELQEHCTQFNWKSVAEKTIDAYKKVLQMPPLFKTIPIPAQRIAIFTPWPPQMSGIAFFSARMIRSLLENSNIEIDVFVEPDPSTLDPCYESRCRILHHTFFLETNNRWPYDNILYCIGNGEYHVYMLPYVFSVPGNIMMHDIRAVGLWWETARASNTPENHYCSSVLRQDGAEKKSAYKFDELCRQVRMEPMIDAGFYMTSDILRAANKVYTLSVYGSKLVKLFGARKSESFFIPVPNIEKKDISFHDNDDNDDDKTFWIGAPGVVSSLKYCDRLIVAFADVHKKHPETKLVFFGPLPPHIDVMLLDLLDSICHECVNSVLFTGGLSTEEYEAWLWKISLAVILRKTSNGEASATIVDMVATETPAIVQDIGSFHELEREGIVRLVKFGASSKEIANEILFVLDHPEVLLSLKKFSRKYASQFTFDTLAVKLLSDPLFLSRP
eukprot:TRINITY_DN154_c0_g1_i1.p1 TRINITY_DN154_c0_g1~~TRINITY_DN154_c0_g1_i1.p1  ORF type:complete len:923 (+),score=175.36 TRINITY_DN154_c0_g1_i1:68-2836(+)